MRKLIVILYIVVVVVMATTTIIEKYTGSDYVRLNIYGAWWFSLLWALLAASGIAWIVKRRVRRWSTLLLHLSLVLILVGAFLSHTLSQQGQLHLRIGETVGQYNDISTKTQHQLPFQLRLKDFNIDYHAGTEAATNYIARITLIDGERTNEHSIAMNKILSAKGYRFYLKSYDEDLQGCSLAMNSDPWGITITYTAYALLFFSLLWLLIDPKGTFRQLLKQISRQSLVIILLICASQTAMAGSTSEKDTTAHTIDNDCGHSLGRILIRYNNRICPLETYALDFTKKLYGKRSYNGMTAEQVLAGFLFWGNEWSNEPIIKVKGNIVKERLKLNDYCSVNDFFNHETGYILGPFIQEYYQGQQDKFHEQVAALDEKLQIIMDLQQLNTFVIYPLTAKGKTIWYSPNSEELSQQTAKISKAQQTQLQKKMEFIGLSMELLYNDALTGQKDHFCGVVQDIRKFQYRNGGESIPSKLQISAERAYNAVPVPTILFMINLTLGLLSLVAIRFSTKGNKGTTLFRGALLISWLALTATIVLRWIISKTIPLNNGYETMLFLAWVVMLIGLIASKKIPFVTIFALLMSGFMLLVSHINQMDPAITPRMPVLNSPLLSVHVSIIMMAYALLSLTFACGIVGLIVKSQARESLQRLSLLLLYPAIACLGLGIFIGAIWANISWGEYWSWDPKETWALITFMIYAAPLHSASISLFRRPATYHIYMTVAFLTLLMTYFGVNYFLGGMHSYA